MRERVRARRLLWRAVRFIYILQVPLFLGLMLALVVFGVSFFHAIIEAVANLDFLDRNKAILLVLDLLDMVFIANLIVMVMVSGYNTYYATSSLSGYRTAARESAEAAAEGDQEGEVEALSPRDEFAPIKSKIAATLVIISGIHLVHEVLSGEIASPVTLIVLAGLHLVLLLTAVVFAWMARIEN